MSNVNRAARRRLQIASRKALGLQVAEVLVSIDDLYEKIARIDNNYTQLVTALNKKRVLPKVVRETKGGITLPDGAEMVSSP